MVRLPLPADPTSPGWFQYAPLSPIIPSNSSLSPDIKKLHTLLHPKHCTPPLPQENRIFLYLAPCEFGFADMLAGVAGSTYSVYTMVKLLAFTCLALSLPPPSKVLFPLPVRSDT